MQFVKLVENYLCFREILYMILKINVCYVRFSCMLFDDFHHFLPRFSYFTVMYEYAFQCLCMIFFLIFLGFHLYVYECFHCFVM